MAKDLTTVNSEVQGIKNEVIEGYNTALRVGTALEDMLAITSKKIGLMGVAVPSTTPDTISGNVSYLASSQGTYTNFNNLVINDEAIYLLSFEGSVWSKYKIMDLPVTNLQTQVDSVSTNIETHKSNTNNPHSVTKSQVGLGNVDNTSDLDKPVSIAQSSAINSVQTDLNAHKGKTDNPHSVTKSQVGLSNVDNTSDIDKPVSTAQQTSISGVQTNLDIHGNNASNPHNVTKSQVGLSNVDNTSDINKPISTATQTALDLKSDKSKQVIAGSGLTGGGTLEADRTFNVGATDDSVIIGADGIRVDTQNNLTSTSITKPLSANQGKVLNDNLTQVSSNSNISECILTSDNITRSVTGWYNMSGILTMQSSWYSIPLTLIVDNCIYFYATYQENNNIASLCFFDSNKNFLSALRVLRTGYYLLQGEIPSNAVYFTTTIFNYPKATVKTGGSIQLKKYIDDSIKNQSISTIPFSDYSPSLMSGSYYNCNTGILVSQSGWNYSTLLLCSGKSIVFTGNYTDNGTVASIIFFDINSNFIAKSSLIGNNTYSDELLIQPEGAYYFAISKSNTDESTYKISDDRLLLSAIAQQNIELQNTSNAKYKNHVFNYFFDYNLFSLKKYTANYDWTGSGPGLSITELSIFNQYGYNKEISLTNSDTSNSNKVIYGISSSDIRTNLKNTRRINFKCFLQSPTDTSFSIQLYKRDASFTSVKSVTISLSANVIKEIYFYYDFDSSYDFTSLQYLQFYAIKLRAGTTIRMSPLEIWDGVLVKEMFINKISNKEINIIRDKSGFVDKQILYIGDSISTLNNFYWKGYLEDYFGLKYLRENAAITIKPAVGGKALYPPVSEIAGNESMWYLCGGQRLVAYAPDKIFLFGGTNDLNAGYNLGASTDVPYLDTDSRPGTLTWSSALKGCIVMLQRDFPGIEIVVCTILDTTGYGTAMYDASFTVKEKMAHLQMEISALYSLKCVPFFWSSGITAENCAVFSNDQVHPNMAGARRLANCVADTLFLR